MSIAKKLIDSVINGKKVEEAFDFGNVKQAVDRAFVDELVLTAENEGDFYRAKDPEGAVDKAFQDYMRMKTQAIRSDFKEARSEIIRQVKESWSDSSIDSGVGYGDI